MKIGALLMISWAIGAMEYQGIFKKIPMVRKGVVDEFLDNVERVIDDPQSGVSISEPLDPTPTEQRFKEVLLHVKEHSECAQRDKTWFQLLVGMNVGIVAVGSILYWYVKTE